VLISGKPGNFIAGADIDQFLEFRPRSRCATGERVRPRDDDRIEKGRVPVVAAIHGACLGGGLEFALAAHYRIAADTPKTVFALPKCSSG
jgi:3-hydroxyacyl-CoA dehydrogenase / enoyl-CoA hydratase / 3-hydroxybutyryl-CoA epimerase